MLISQVIEKIETELPLELQDDWDNSGLQLGDTNQELRGIFLCVDVTTEVISQALAANANLIIAHHPLLFSPTKQIDYRDFKSKKMMDAIKNDLVIYAIHTNVDVHIHGLNAYVLEEMGFKNLGKLMPTLAPHGYGNLSELSSMRLAELIDEIKDKLDLDHVIYYGDKESKIDRLALVTGSGMDFLQACLAEKVDLLITADIKHHEAMDALEQGLMLIDLGHYESEKFFNQYMYYLLNTMKITDSLYIEKPQKIYARKIG